MVEQVGSGGHRGQVGDVREGRHLVAEVGAADDRARRRAERDAQPHPHDVGARTVDLIANARLFFVRKIAVVPTCDFHAGIQFAEIFRATCVDSFGRAEQEKFQAILLRRTGGVVDEIRRCAALRHRRSGQ